MYPPPVASDTSTSATAIDIESPETIIRQNGVQNVKFSRDHQEIRHLLDAVDKLQKSTDSATMDRIKAEFRSILFSISPVKNRVASNPSSAYTDSEYSSYNSQQEGTNSNSEVIPKEAIDHLQSIAHRMVAAGYSRELIEVYTSARKTDVDEKFKKLLGIERMSSKNIQRLEWRVQQEKIQLWTQAAKICVRWLFAGERTLTKQILQGLGTQIAHDCFVKTVKDSAIQFFNFVEAISGSRRSPEKLFKILDLYRVLSDLSHDIAIIFDSKSGEFIRKRAVKILSSLSEAARGILSEFEKAVFGDISEALFLEGAVHPLTEYVMNYIHDMLKYTRTLNRLIVSNPSSLDYIRSSELDFDFSEFEGKLVPLELHLVWIIVVLKYNLQGKSKQYKDTSLAHLFMRNNVDYIVQAIKMFVESRIINFDYQDKLISLAEANYQKSTRRRRSTSKSIIILDCFRCAGLGKVESFGLR